MGGGGNMKGDITIHRIHTNIFKNADYDELYTTNPGKLILTTLEIPEKLIVR